MLPADKSAAVVAGWRGWVSPPEVLAEVWSRVPDIAECPPDIDETDWLRLTAALEISKLGFGAERQIWLETVGDLMSQIRNDSDSREQLAAEMTDSFFLLAPDIAKPALITTTAKCVAMAGIVAARLLCRGLYESTRPDATTMRSVLRSVPHLEYQGRIYPT